MGDQLKRQAGHVVAAPSRDPTCPYKPITTHAHYVRNARTLRPPFAAMQWFSTITGNKRQPKRPSMPRMARTGVDSPTICHRIGFASPCASPNPTCIGLTPGAIRRQAQDHCFDAHAATHHLLRLAVGSSHSPLSCCPRFVLESVGSPAPPSHPRELEALTCTPNTQFGHRPHAFAD